LSDAFVIGRRNFAAFRDEQKEVSTPHHLIWS